MILEGKVVLLISPEPWDHIPVSKHHYARKLADLNALVLFANPPGKKWFISKSDNPGIWILDYTRFVKGLRYLPEFISKRIIKAKFKKIQNLYGAKIDIIWSFDNSVFFNFNSLSSYNILHTVDLNQDFEIQKAAKTADLCLYNCDPIGKKIRPWNENCHFINHGYTSTSVVKPIEIPQGKGLKIGYAGNLDIKYIDWETIKGAMISNQDHTFYFAGPISDKSKLDVFTNIKLLGRIDHGELLSFYQQMDLLIICYLADDFRDQLSNTHKMMEYLGSGKPIVTTFTETYDGLDFIAMSNSNSEWINLLNDVMDNLEYWRTDKMIERRKSYAMDNTYEKQLLRIEELISSTQ